jgi:hypothetical protein
MRACKKRAFKVESAEKVAHISLPLAPQIASSQGD